MADDLNLFNLLPRAIEGGYNTFVQPWQNLFTNINSTRAAPYGGGPVPPAPGMTESDKAFRSEQIPQFINDYGRWMQPWEQELLKSYISDPNAPKQEIAKLFSDIQSRAEDESARTRTLNQFDESVAGLKLPEQIAGLEKTIGSGDYLSDDVYRSAFAAANNQLSRGQQAQSARTSQMAAGTGVRDSGFASDQLRRTRDAGSAVRGNLMSGFAGDANQRLQGLRGLRTQFGLQRAELAGSPNWRGINIPDFTSYGVGQRTSTIGGNQFQAGVDAQNTQAILNAIMGAGQTAASTTTNLLSPVLNKAFSR